jgi:hypothetical protein
MIWRVVKTIVDCTFSAGLTVFTSGKAALTLRFVKATVPPIFRGEKLAACLYVPARLEWGALQR